MRFSGWQEHRLSIWFGILASPFHSLFPRMKTSNILVASLLFGFVNLLQAQPVAKATPADTDYAVTERGANHRVWQRTTYEQGPNGKVVPHVHSYTELATGMHYKDANTGQWLESQELIEAFSGGAVARQGQHQVVFANNLNSAGAIDMQTPDGKRLRSNILGLMYYDPATGNAVLIAELKDSEGGLISDNQVLYPDVFEGVKADVQYTYRRDGFEQDVILREQPPTPESFGMNPDTTELEVFTEFINPPEASVKDNAADNGLEADQEIGWGAVTLGRGKAFNLGGQTAQAPVAKRYVKIQGRYFLLEKVSMKDILPAVSKLPEQAANPVKLPVMAFKSLVLPKTPLARLGAGPMRLASSSLPNKGYVLDYVTLNSSTNNYTFQGDITYYVSGSVNLFGVTTIEGGSVLKYATNGNLAIYGSINCQTAPYRSAVLTAKDDNAVGEIISGSTGTPSGYYGTCFSYGTTAAPQQLHDLRISHVSQFISMGNSLATNSLINIQIYHVGYVINAYNSGGWKFQNLLIARVGNAVIYSASMATISGEHLTVDQAKTICSGITLYLTNSLLSSITNMGTFTSVNNVTNSSGGGVFQTVGSGAYYLITNSSCRNAGTTNIDPALLAQLRQKTTYPPIVYSNTTISAATTFSPQAQRDTDVPDLGYHYDPLDYAFGGVKAITNLTFAAGTSVGWFELPSSYANGYGISITNGMTITLNGTVLFPCIFARYSVVQEGGNGNWKDRSYPGGIVNQTVYDPNNIPNLRATFTRFTHLAADNSHFRDGSSGQPLAIQATHCEFLNTFGGYNILGSFTNCLFSGLDFWQGTSSTFPYEIFRNCTFHGGSFGITHWESGAPYWYSSVRNCAFEGTTTSIDHQFGTNSAYADYDYNAFLTGANHLATEGTNNVVVTNFNWQTSWFGNYYLPTNSTLINAGSTNANLLALYHFTTQTNQMKEATSIVDIGYHYVATDAYGNPYDTDGDGTPDYWEDTNGNGIFDAGDLGNWLINAFNGLSVGFGLQVFTPLK